MKVIAVTKFPTSILAESSSPLLFQPRSEPKMALDTPFQTADVEPNNKKNNVNADLNLTFVDEIYGAEKLLDMLPVADYVSLHTPLTEETRTMIRTRELGLMKRSAYLINVARAQIVDKDSLYNALLNSDIVAAAFDVFWQEPPDPDDRLLKLQILC
jgi:lactate dehydrogenase-like 2-hydroxyacid dehydrogenase